MACSRTTRIRSGFNRLSRFVSRHNRLFTVVTAIVLSVGLSGCLIIRATDVRDQFCELDSNFNFQFDESGTMAARLESQYARVHSLVDFKQKKMTVRIRI